MSIFSDEWMAVADAAVIFFIRKKDGVYGENNFRRTEKDNLPVYLR